MNVKFERYGTTGIAFRFDAKPDDKIRSTLKANGFRWSPGAGVWWRPKAGKYADLLCYIEKLCNPGRPDGTCWDCKAAPGYFRNEGAATPVRCNACQEKAIAARIDADRLRLAADDFDQANNRSL